MQPRSNASPGLRSSFWHMLMYLALVPKTLILWSCAMRHITERSGYPGLPSNSTTLAPVNRALTSQFHIIQPQVVK